MDHSKLDYLVEHDGVVPSPARVDLEMKIGEAVVDLRPIADQRFEAQAAELQRAEEAYADKIEAGLDADPAAHHAAMLAVIETTQLQISGIRRSLSCLHGQPGLARMYGKELAMLSFVTGDLMSTLARLYGHKLHLPHISNEGHLCGFYSVEPVTRSN